MAAVAPKGSMNPHYIDDAKVIFPWFSGKETPMNRKGDRNFGLVLTQEKADELKADGYLVKVYRPKGEDGQPDMSVDGIIYIKCKLNFESSRPPRVNLVTCIDDVCKRTPLDSTNITLLDSADIEMVDCKIGPYDWKNASGEGRAAYVQNLFVKVNLDRYDAKYDALPMGEAPGPLPDDGDFHNE
jgi:hypothetical protein